MSQEAQPSPGRCKVTEITFGAGAANLVFDRIIPRTAPSEPFPINMRQIDDADWIGNIARRAGGETCDAKMAMRGSNGFAVEAFAILRSRCSETKGCRAAADPDHLLRNVATVRFMVMAQ
jgi:hypothetical protein